MLSKYLLLYYYVENRCAAKYICENWHIFLGSFDE